MYVYSFDDYRDFLREEITRRRGADPKVSFRALAESMRIQKPYLSKVVHKKAQLNGDQLFLACRYLNLAGEEERYLELSHQLQCCSLHTRRQSPARQVKKVQDEHRKTSEHIATRELPNQQHDRYYLDPLNQIVHVAVSIARYACDLSVLASDLGLPFRRIDQVSRDLRDLGIIAHDGERWKSCRHDLHLDPKSAIYQAWKNSVRLWSVNKSQNTPDSKSYGFTAFFSADLDAEAEIRDAFLKFLGEAQRISKDSGKQAVYQLNFDLLNWT